jgi:hypothetical protein
LDYDFKKVEFLHALPNIRDKAFTESTIKSAFRKSGLVPYNPNVVLDSLPDLEPEPPKLAPRLEPRPTLGPIECVTPRTVPEWLQAEKKARSMVRKVQIGVENLTPSKVRHLDKVLRRGNLGITKATTFESDLERYKKRADERTTRSKRKRFVAQEGGVVRIRDAKEIAKAKTEADKLRIETTAERRALIAKNKAKYLTPEYIYDSDAYLEDED